jgi:hypothetical protein
MVLKQNSTEKCSNIMKQEEKSVIDCSKIYNQFMEKNSL